MHACTHALAKQGVILELLSDASLKEPADVLLLCEDGSHRTAAVLSHIRNDAAVAEDVAAGNACGSFSRKVTQGANARVLHSSREQTPQQPP